MAIGFKPIGANPKIEKLVAEGKSRAKKISREISEIPANPKKRKPKDIVTMRLDAEITEFFRDTGEGWQTRINTVLRNYVQGQKGRVE